MSTHPLLIGQDWSFPVPIVYGPGRLAEIGQHSARLGIKHPLIITDRGSRDLPFVDALLGHLQQDVGKAGIFSDISPNPRDDEIMRGRDVMRQAGHDGVIAIGGGSAMDGGKAICLTATNDIDLWAFNYDEPAPDLSDATPFPKLVTIPTTAGTGAETESTAMVTHTGKGMKFCVWHAELKPSLALLDPELTLGLPAHLTAWTGVDALTHAIEAFCVPGFHPLCDGLALEALSLIGRWLPRAVEHPGDLEARGAMLTGSCLAGIAFMKGLGLVHAISHMVGAEYDTQHGLTNAITLPTVLRFNLPGMEEKTARMGEAMGLGPVTPDAFIAYIEALLDRLSIPKTLGEIDVPMEAASRLAEKAVQDAAAGTNPRAASIPEVARLIEIAIVTGR